MGNSPTEQGSQLQQASPGQGERLVYVVPAQALGHPVDDEIGLRQLWSILWRGKWIVFSTTVTFAMLSVAYALLATEWYRAETLLAPSEERATPSIGAQLGGLAALAGVSVGGGRSAEPLAVLRSREFARDFVQDFGLLNVLFADDWDAGTSRWKAEDPEDWPDLRDAVRFFHEKIFKVQEDPQTRLVILAIEWTDPAVAANWANALAERVNSRLREQALVEAEANVAYLQGELAGTGVITLQQSVSRLLEGELQKLMLARGNEEFAFRIIDPATAPKYRVRPNRPAVAVIGTMLGAILGFFWVLVWHAARRGN